MTNEELMMPRYEVIADYPGKLYQVGDLLAKMKTNLQQQNNKSE